MKINKTRLNIQFRQTLSMDAALDIQWLSALQLVANNKQKRKIES